MEGRTEHDARAQSGDIEGADSGSEVLDGLIELFRAQNNGADPTETHLKKWAETIREMTVSSGGSVSPSLDASPSHDKAESPSKQTSAPPISTTTTTKPENGQKDAPKQSKVSPRKTKRRVYSRASFKRIKLDVPPIITRLRQQATDGTNHAIFTQMQQHVLELDKIAGMVSKAQKDSILHCQDSTELAQYQSTFGQQIYQRMQQKIFELEEMTVHIKMWIRLHLPKKKSGRTAYFVSKKNLFGMISSMRSTGLNVLQTITQHVVARASKLRTLKKALAKGMNIQDYGREIVDMEALHNHNLLTAVTGIRDAYIMVIDRVYKDFDPLNTGL